MGVSPLVRVSLRSLGSVFLPMTVLSWEGSSGIRVVVPVGSFWAEVGEVVRGMGRLSCYAGGDIPGCNVPELSRGLGPWI